MRTKTIIAAAAILAVSMATTVAQTNVYSQNVVGYINVTVPAGGYALIANQLNASPDNTLKNVIPKPPPGTYFYKFNGGYVMYYFDPDDEAWSPHGNVTLAPGEGGMIKNPLSTPLTITFVGEVPQGRLTNALPAGYSVRSSIVPQAGRVTTDLGLPMSGGDYLYKFAGGYSTFYFDPDDQAWTPSEPTINVGEAFMLRKGSAVNWIRNFTVQ